MTNEEANKATVREIFKAIDAGDLAVLDLHPGYWQTREFMPKIKMAFPDLQHTIKEQIAEGDLVATFSIVWGTHQGTFLGVPAFRSNGHLPASRPRPSQ